MGRDHTDTWFFFGDSVTLGVNDTERPGGWVSRLALLGAAGGAYDLPPATFYNLGCRNQKLAQIDARFEQEYQARIIPGIRSRLAFCAGTVDILGGAEPLSLAAGLTRMLGRARAIAPSLFICPPPVAPDAARQGLRNFGLLAVDVCRGLNVPCINLFDELMERDFTALLTDAVHPGPQGNALLAERLFAQPEMKTFLAAAEARG